MRGRGIIWRGGVLLAAALLVSSCGDDSSTTDEGAAEPSAADSQDGAGEDGATDEATDADEAPSDGPGNATLTVDGVSYTFARVLCAFGPDEIGDEDAEFVLSAIEDGLQLYLSIDGDGHLMTLDDIDDFEDPSVGWSAGGPVSSITGSAEDFIVVDGKRISAEVTMVDSTDDELDGAESHGSLEATCP